MSINIARRKFIATLGGAAAWPVSARAQQGERMRRIGVLSGAAADDLDGQARYAAFLQGLQQLGWTDGRNVRIDTAGPQAMPPTLANTRQKWSRLRLMSSCLLAPLVWRRCSSNFGRASIRFQRT